MKATFKNFTVSAKYKGNKAAPWSDGKNQNWNNHLVTVTNTETKQRCTFEFWASIANPKLSTEYDVLNAFYRFVNDAISGKMDFYEFCSEFGYDNDSRTSERIWKSCKRATAKLERIYNGDISDLANELSKDYA